MRAIIVSIICMLLLCACSTHKLSHKTVDLTTRIAHADTLFYKEKFEEAASEFTSIIKTSPQNDVVAHARYTLAMIEVSANNADGDYAKALILFTTFIKHHPRDVRCKDANNWIKVLNLLSRITKDYNNISVNKSNYSTPVSKDIELQNVALEDLLRSVNAEKDSLVKRIKKLEKTIEDLDKIE